MGEQARAGTAPGWYIDKPGNVVHAGSCTHREDAPAWRLADTATAAAPGRDPSSVVRALMVSRDLCPAPCMRGLRCADHGFRPTGQLDLLGGTS